MKKRKEKKTKEKKKGYFIYINDILKICIFIFVSLNKFVILVILIFFFFCNNC